MPTYEYGCAACGGQWEELQRITEPATEVCPQCGKKAAHRLISAGTNFILKGGGWYSDLYASPKGSSGSKTETKDGASSDAGSKSESKGESKSDTKTETKAAASAPSTTPPSTSSSS